MRIKQRSAYKIKGYIEHENWKENLKQLQGSKQDRERPARCKHDGETWTDEQNQDAICSQCGFVVRMGEETSKIFNGRKPLFGA